MDFERAALLLAVAKACTEWPKLRAIHDEALRELEAIAVGEPEHVLVEEESESESNGRRA